MFNRLRNFWAHSYQSDPTAFWYEITSFIFTVGASLYLALTANEPNMALVYPGFFVGAVTGMYGYYRRHLFWPMLLTKYFAVINVFGFGRALNWW